MRQQSALSGLLFEVPNGGELSAAVGPGWVLVCFAALCVMAIAFVHRFLPETKGRSVEEITEIFEREARTGETAAVTA
jgi:H+/Cl- antiporter ClcA